MDIFDKLYDESEKVKVRFIGFTTDDVRYDFGLVYTNMFFGKPLVVCMQTGRSSLLDVSDLHDLDHIKKVFNIPSTKDAADLASFFEEALPTSSLETQYD